MRDLEKLNNPFSDGKVIDSCSIFGMMDTSGRRFSGRDIARAIGNMHVRGNGLGGGFAVYGLYPEYAEYYAFHIMYNCEEAREETERYLRSTANIIRCEEVDTFPVRTIARAPRVWRYFLEFNPHARGNLAMEDYIVDRVMEINARINDAYVFSSGKNMAVFKGVGYPEEIAEFFSIENYEGYLWTAHGRFPTNSVAWWGGAHPFSILDWTVVHNGEISSYGINRRYLEQYGYQCTMQTDTEVVAYAVDLLMRKHNLPIEIVAKIFSAPFWNNMHRYAEEERKLYVTLRQVYGSLLLNGPFTIIIGRTGEMIGLTDRIRLRPLTAGIKDSVLYLSSEESAIRLICPDLDETWIPVGGEPIAGHLGTHPSASRASRSSSTKVRQIP